MKTRVIVDPMAGYKSQPAVFEVFAPALHFVTSEK